ncbi:MAG TPA: NAD(P)/FAD-dependent oxidoreductase, partial [Solirubrobacteraceae bacterium]|nr:NAD(P)/FAD-dependent oxidoreductase [Solirubrobacteraceae bacterium]
AELLSVSDVVSLTVEGAGRIVELAGGVQLSANTVLVASGVSYRMMPAPGFADFTGAGVYYGAALTEARSCAEQHVVVIGAANSAGQAAVHFADYATRVTMLVRGDSLQKSMSAYLIDQIARLPAIEVLTRTQAISAEGDNGRLKRLRLRGVGGDGVIERTVDVDACFVFIGAAPRTDWLDGVVARDERGFILAGPDAREHGWPLQREPRTLETSVPGVFVAGDVRARSIKRVASAVGEGSMAVSLIHEYLAEA